MIVKKVSIFYIYCMMATVLSANEVTSVEPSIHDLVAQIKHATVTEKRILLDTLKVQLRTSQKKIRHQVMIEFRKGSSKPKLTNGVKDD